MGQSGFFQFEEDPFNKGAQGVAVIMHEALSMMKFCRRNHEIEKLQIISICQ